MFTALSLGSCSLPRQTLISEQRVYRSVPNDEGSHSIEEGSSTKKVKGKITDKGDYLIFTPSDSLTNLRIINSTESPPDSWKLDNVGKWYFPESKNASANTTLWYRDERVVLQSLTIPLKIM